MVREIIYGTMYVANTNQAETRSFGALTVLLLAAASARLRLTPCTHCLCKLNARMQVRQDLLPTNGASYNFQKSCTLM